MAGHSKFKNIMHRKGAQDRKRAKLFSRLGKEITVAAKMGGIDPDMNPRLRLAISAARAGNMPNDRIKKAIEVADPDNKDATDYEEIRYEGYGPGGIAIIVEVLTDNRNRAISEMRLAFSKNGGTLGESNSVSFMFDRVGEIVYPEDKADEDTMFEAAVEAGADNAELEDGEHIITTNPDDFGSVLEAMDAKFETPERSGLTWRAQNLMNLDVEKTEKAMKLVESLEDLDDVQLVCTNLDVSDEVAAMLADS